MTGAALLLGGGAVGRAVAAALGRDRAFGRVIVADRCRHRAAAAAERCGGKAVAVRLNCADDAAVAPLLREVSLALNTAELPPEGFAAADSLGGRGRGILRRRQR